MKTISLTIDTEPDFGGRFNTFRGINKGLPLLLNILREYNIKATFFVSGDILERFPSTINVLNDVGMEIASHCSEHIKLNQTDNPKKIIRDTVIQFERIMGFKPKGFRAPYLMPNKDLPSLLHSEKFEYDSSLTQAYMPLRYNYLRIPQSPYYPSLSDIKKVQNKGPIKEIPISRIPFSFSAFSLLQASLRLPKSSHFKQENIVLFFHLHDLLGWDSNKLNKLPFYLRSFYLKSKNNPTILKNIIEMFLDREFVKMGEL